MPTFYPPITNSTSGFYRQSQTQMGALRSEAEKIQTQIASQKRLERSSDDPVASARLRHLSRTDRLAAIDQQTAARASEELNGAANNIESISNTLVRIKELTLQAANDTNSTEIREIIANELDELRKSIFANANAISNTGRPLFGGETGQAAYESDSAGNITYIGTTSSGSLTISEDIKVERGITGPNLLNFDANGTPTDIFAFLQSLSAGLRTGADPSQIARDSLAGLDNAIDTVSRAQAVIGVRAAWVDNVQLNATLRAESRAQEGGEIGGVTGFEVIQLKQTLAVLEMSMESFGRLSSLNLFDAI